MDLTDFALSEVKDAQSISVECGTPPVMGHSDQSPLPLHRKSSVLTNFCTEHNVQECASRINQEVLSLGLAPVWVQSGDSSDMNVVSVLNCMYELLQLHRRGLQTLENMEMEQLKSSNNVDSLQLTSTRLKDQLELSKRENTGLLERERQLQLKVKSLQNCLKNEKDEIHKLQNIVSSRASQYNHEMKRKERELNKLKERLNQLLADKKEKKLAIDVSNKLGRVDGRRSLWKTEKTEAKHEGDMYKTLLRDYESRQGDLLMENAELRKVLKQMKKDMAVILASRKSSVKGDRSDDGAVEADSDEEEAFDCGKEAVELFSVHTREKLTNSVRRQWRRLKNHVDRLDSRESLASSTGESESTDTVAQSPSKEMDKLKQEVQQCKDYIQTQQDVLQQQLSSQCDETTTTAMPGDCYTPQGKDGPREEWKTLQEQRKIFEQERRNFTEAAVRLSQERKTFEEERAVWLKHQYLNVNPKKPTRSKSQCAFQIFSVGKPRLPGPRPPPPAPPGGHQGVPRPAVRQSLQCVLGLPRGLLPAGHAWNTSPGRRPGGIRTRCSSHLSWLLLFMRRSSGSTLSSSRITELLTLSLRLKRSTVQHRLQNGPSPPPHQRQHQHPAYRPPHATCCTRSASCVKTAPPNQREGRKTRETRAPRRPSTDGGSAATTTAASCSRGKKTAQFEQSGPCMSHVWCCLSSCQTIET
ncbi:afadin- and alpha-actinin-binding protein-like isoform X2 [Dunckerocampus dactyliophorus]|uniref:afadin- and alpha-actinin-binding protein-like isoform X2 n=1 Tax=Dunckerocampus dactyliophorus TaxID=161453 RepID=UPI0024070F3F|nr:afadin- and alpha-actinin-binding protein-like isoform X2 [Dunckerocampus dactyliophorus]